VLAPQADPELLAAARATIAALMRHHHVPGLSVAVTGPSRLIHAEGFGRADVARNRPATPDTAYLWFSMSKIATATVAVRLADEGILDLDAPVSEHVPAYRARAGEQPTVRHLLSHTAGAPNPLPVRWVLPADATDAEVRSITQRILDRHGHPSRSVGGPARYSNVGYLVLAEVISAAAGEPFEDHVRRVLLQPAGMHATGYRPPDTADRATGYVRLPRGLAPALRMALPAGIVGGRSGHLVALRPFRVAGAGYGGLVGGVTDAARLLRLHLADGLVDGTRILRPGSARAMRDIRAPGRPFDLGLGWFCRPADRAAHPAFVEHWGTGGGFWNALRLYPDQGVGIAVMANTTRPYEHHALMTALLQAVIPRTAASSTAG
jgi:CubicO group peptidase (beta-lactamase class C family)